MQKEKIRQKQNGITLIALIITIIVMLILVGVSVTVALNGGLFSSAQDATARTEAEKQKEEQLASGRVKIGNTWYDSLQHYAKGEISEDQSDSSGGTEITYKQSIEGLAEGVTLITYDNLETETSADIKEAVDAGKIQAVLEETVTEDGETITYTAVVPTGFEISTTDGEDSISGGLVIKDGLNEFVWVPVENASSFTDYSFGPLTGIDSKTTYVYDSQEELNYYYGMKEDNTTPYYNYADFTYEADKTNVEESIKTYGGFYVGRYETTIDGSTIGVQQGKTVLTASTLLKTGTNQTSNEEYHYRWWGLYKAQKDMYADNNAVGSLMISRTQWSLILTFTEYGEATRADDTYTIEPDLSGAAYKTNSSQYDVSKNIYDLAGNVQEYTLTMATGTMVGDIDYARSNVGGGIGQSDDVPAGSYRNNEYTPNKANTSMR